MPKPRAIWVTFGYSGGTHPAGVPEERLLLEAWRPLADMLRATVKSVRFLPANMLDHNSVTLTAQYDYHRARAVTRLDKMMIDGGGSKTDPSNYYDMDALMLEFNPFGGISNLYDGLLSKHVAYNAHWVKAELAYKDELTARNLTPEIIHYRTIAQPNIHQDLTYPAAKATRHDDLIASLGSDFYPLTLTGLNVMSPRAYILGKDDGAGNPTATVEAVESLAAANIAENTRLAAIGGLDPKIVPTIFMRYEGSSDPLWLQLLSDPLALALLRAAFPSMEAGGFAVWHNMPFGVPAEAAQILEWNETALENNMATLGLTKLEAINQMLFALDGAPPVSALDPGGASEQGEAETALDHVDEFIQMLGWPDNTNFGDELTAAGTSGSMTITVPSTTLDVKGRAPWAYADVSLKGDLLVDNRAQTTVFPDSQQVQLDVIRQEPFADLSPRLKHLILRVATQYWVRRKKGDPEADKWLAEEAVWVDRNVRRHGVEVPTDHRNAASFPPQGERER